MSVLIKGMEMPKNCGGCFLRVGQCSRRIYMENRPSTCPIIEVPEQHGRLIDADGISEHKYTTIPPYRKEYADGKTKSEDEIIAFKFGWNNAIDGIVEIAPTVIPAEEGET